MNTGDARGDLYFDLRSVYTPLECAHPTTSRTAHDCDNIEVTAPDLLEPDCRQNTTTAHPNTPARNNLTPTSFLISWPNIGGGPIRGC